MVASVSNMTNELNISLWRAQVIHLLWKQYKKEGLMTTATLMEQIGWLLGASEGFFGWEYVNQGLNKKSPSFYYLNSGDTYSTTLLITLGDKSRMIISSYGDQIEEGNYE